MRPYRGKRIDNDKWVEGCLYAGNDGRCYILATTNTEKHGHSFSMVGHCIGVTPTHEVHPETKGQATGLKDKAGTDLDWWEGDLFKLGEADYVIIYKDGGFWFEKCSDKSVTPSWMLTEHNQMKKLGTIHENPELKTK